MNNWKLFTHALIYLGLLTWVLKEPGRETSLDLDLCTSDILRVYCLHLEGISNNPLHIGLDHVELTKISTIFSPNILVLQEGPDIAGIFANQPSQ